MTSEHPPVANAPCGAGAGPLPHTPPIARPGRRVHLVGNAHLDPVWLWPWQEGYAETRATFWSVIHRMEEYPDFVFSCDQVVLLDWTRESDPVLFEKIKQRAAEGRWVNVGGWWVEPDCNMPMGESFVRQGLYGQRFLLEHFGKPATVGMNVDPFGHTATLPMILRGQGMTGYTFMRPGPHEEGALPDTPFTWVAPDGSEVIASRIPFEYCSTDGDLALHTDKAIGQLDRSFDDVMIFYGVGNHGGGPTRANLDSIARYRRMGTYGDLIMSSPVEYFDAVRKLQEAGTELPESRGDLQHHAPGCYSAHSGIKRWQRRAQHAVLTAERWSIVADLLGRSTNPHLADARAELGHAWRQVLFNQFHDVLPGSAIEPAYEDARDQLGEAVAIAKRITTRAHNALAREIDIPFVNETQPVVVFNPHPWPVRAAVELNYGLPGRGAHVTDNTGAEVTSQSVPAAASMEHPGRGAIVFDAEVPGLGYATYRLRPGAAAATDTGLRATETTLTNARLAVEIDPRTGWVRSLIQRDSGTDVLAGARGPHWQICADASDTWGHHVVSYAWPGAEPALDRIHLIADGPLRATIRVERSWGRSTIVEDITLRHDSDAVEIHVEIDWRQQGELAKMRIPVGLAEPEATFEVPFATVTREVNGAEDPAQSWVDLSGPTLGGPTTLAGLTVINNAKHGYDTSPADSPQPDTSPSIGITAVRSTVYAWNDPREISDADILRYQDQGVQAFDYTLVPHAGDWRSVAASRRAAELGQPVRAMLESSHPGPLPPRAGLANDGEGTVMITAIKGSEDPGDEGAEVIVRAVETTGHRARATLSLPFAERRLVAEFEPHQLRTFRIPRPGAGGRVVEVDLLEQQRRPRAGALTTSRLEPAVPPLAGQAPPAVQRDGSWPDGGEGDISSGRS